MSGLGGLTRRGWSLLGGAGALTAMAVLFGIGELYPFAVAAVVLVAGAAFWTRSCEWELSTERRVRPLRVPAGAHARVELSVRNCGSRRSPVVTARDPFDNGRRSASFLIAPLEPGETAKAAYLLPTAKRGVYPVGPLRLELSDPFGLARVVRSGALACALTVHPAVEAVRTLPLATGTDRESVLGDAVLSPSGDEFYALREYRVGDDLRHVHWASTARLDELMIRQAQSQWRGRLTVVVDVRAGGHSPESFEAALSAAASISIAALEAGIHVRLATTAGADTGFGTALTHRTAILDELAAAVMQPAAELAGLLRQIPSLSSAPAVVITSDRSSESDLHTACKASQRDGTVVVVVEASGQPRRALPRLPCPVVVLPRGARFGRMWDATLRTQRAPGRG